MPGGRAPSRLAGLNSFGGPVNRIRVEAPPPDTFLAPRRIAFDGPSLASLGVLGAFRKYLAAGRPTREPARHRGDPARERRETLARRSARRLRRFRAGGGA